MVGGRGRRLRTRSRRKAPRRKACRTQGRRPMRPPSRKQTEPFAFADFTWLTGNPRTKESPLDTPVFTGEVRVDVAYHYDFSHPQDDTIVGSSEVFRSEEFQLTQLGVGGDFHYDNVRARLMTQFGTTTRAGISCCSPRSTGPRRRRARPTSRRTPVTSTAPG